MRQVLQAPLQVWEEKDPLLYWTADSHCWVFHSLYLLKETKSICCSFMPYIQKAYSNSPVGLVNITQQGANLSHLIKESSILEILLKVLPWNACNLTKRGNFPVFKVTSEYQRVHQIHASCCCCCAAGTASWKEPKQYQRKPGLRTGQHSETSKALHWGLKNISQKVYICLWKGSSFSESLGGHWKAPPPSWHTSLVSVPGVMSLHMNTVANNFRFFH